jgi:hypothetical protein
MRKANHTAFASDLHELIHRAQMTDYDRDEALAAADKAEALVDAIIWVKGKFAAFGNLFLKPSLRH